MRYTHTQIEQGRRKIIENAKELLEESQILYQHERFARTYTLCQLAFEELAKIPILAAATERVRNDERYDWSAVQQNILHHLPKLSFSIQFNPEQEERFLKITGDEEFNLDRTALAMNRLKNQSLYAGKKYRDFLKPSDIITKEMAEHMFHIAKDYFEFLEIYEETLHGDYNEELTDGEIEEIISHLNHFPFIEIFENPEELDTENVRLTKTNE